MTGQAEVKKIIKKKRQKIKKLTVITVSIKNAQKFKLNFVIKLIISAKLQ